MDKMHAYNEYLNMMGEKKIKRNSEKNKNKCLVEE